MQTKEMSMSAMPPIVGRAIWQEQIDEVRVREKLHTREGDAIAAARRRLPMVEVDPTARLVGPAGDVRLIDTFEGRTQLLASYMMWHDGLPAAGQCEGCTKDNGQVRDLSFLHSRDVTFAVFCEGPFPESDRYREFMGWEMPFYSVPETSRDALIAGRDFGMTVCYLRNGDQVFETYWTTGRGHETMGSAYPMLDQTVYGRQESWEDSPEGWPRLYLGTRSEQMRTDQQGRSVRRPGGRPIMQWPRLAAGHSDDLGAAAVAGDTEHRH